MADVESTGGDAAAIEAKPAAKKKHWYQRPTVRALRKEAESDVSVTGGFDQRENDETRLPLGEAIHFGGLVLTEAFTPSTVSALYRTLDRWPSQRADQRRQWSEQLERSRGGSGGGWTSLGVVRPPGGWVLSDGYNDPDLPAGVDAVWLHMSFVTPSLAMVVATFTLAEEAGDLSELLRRDYRTTHFDVRLHVYGRLGSLRARIPWARPALHAGGYRISSAEDQKKRAAAALVGRYEEACGDWFFGKFKGRFAAAKPEERPVIRMYFTQEEVPYAQRHAWLRPIDLDFALPLWRSTQPEGWWLAEQRWSYGSRPYVMTLAARRRDAAQSPGGDQNGESNWHLTQVFGSDQAPLAARHAIFALLGVYAHRLAALRDKAGIRHFPRRLVREARNLDDFLIRDGLDAATVTADLRAFTEDLTDFSWGVPEFSEEPRNRPPQVQAAPMSYLRSLRDAIRQRAERLASDTTTTTGSIKASAELRQSIANTSLQRFILALAAIAAIIAVISLLVAKH